MHSPETDHSESSEPDTKITEQAQLLKVLAFLKSDDGAFGSYCIKSDESVENKILKLRSACSGVEETTRDNFAADEETTRKTMDDLQELKKELFLEIKRPAHSPEADPPVIKPVLSKKHLAAGGVFAGVDEKIQAGTGGSPFDYCSAVTIMHSPGADQPQSSEEPVVRDNTLETFLQDLPESHIMDAISLLRSDDGACGLYALCRHAELPSDSPSVRA